MKKLLKENKECMSEITIYSKKKHARKLAVREKNYFSYGKLVLNSAIKFTALLIIRQLHLN